LILGAVFMFPASTHNPLKYIQDGSLFFIALSATVLFILTHVSVVEAATMDLDFGKDRLSATIEESPLKAVIEKIAEKEGIWIKGAENLVDEIYSVEFEDVSIREAMERMLEPFNCCYFIDREGGLVGIIIVSKKSRRGSPQRRPVSRKLPRRSRRR
jgi:hypothetical protein